MERPTLHRYARRWGDAQGAYANVLESFMPDSSTVVRLPEVAMRRFLIPWALLFAMAFAASAQEKSAKPGINDPFKNPDVEKFQKTFEGESREVFVQRDKIVDACGVKPGMVVADIGAGTGIHTRVFSKAVGDAGQVYAVDIAAKFLEHIQKTCRAAGLRNVTPVLCNEDSVDLPPNSVDVAFTCDTYHHFEYPQRTLASLYRAIKPGGKLVVVDFIRIAGKSSAWILFHVRAGQEVVEKELTDAGFRKKEEVKDLLKENYIIVFTKPMPQPK
jgi:ubiquinone/menaquinone biosynthesis C-methylase UbiE